MCVTCPNLSHQPSAMWNAKRQLSRTSFSHPHRRTESCPRGPGFIAGGSLPRGDRQKPLRLQRSCSFRKSWMESSQRCNHIHYMKYHDNQPGWWCNNHLEKWWSSSMGRMTTHILWKKTDVWNHQPDNDNQLYLWIWVSWQGAILSYFYLLSLHWEPRGATRSFTTTWWLHIMVNHFFF